MTALYFFCGVKGKISEDVERRASEFREFKEFKEIREGKKLYSLSSLTSLISLYSLISTNPDNSLSLINSLIALCCEKKSLFVVVY